MLKRLRERAASEKGFTLIELLVVMLILGILAAIAIPAFLNQKNKANDSQAKTVVRSMETAMETCGTDNNGIYNAAANPCNIAALNAIEKTIPNGLPASIPTLAANNYKVSYKAPSTNTTFSITRTTTGAVTRQCVLSASTADHGGCTLAPGGTTGTW